MNRVFSSIRVYDRQESSPKACKICNGPATRDALFDVGDGVLLVERYCEQCAAKVPQGSNTGRSA